MKLSSIIYYCQAFIVGKQYCDYKLGLIESYFHLREIGNKKLQKLFKEKG